MIRKSMLERLFGKKIAGVSAVEETAPIETPPVVEKKPKRQPPSWRWCSLNSSGTVTAWTRGEARAKVKDLIDVPRKQRLPQDTTVQRVA